MKGLKKIKARQCTIAAIVAVAAFLFVSCGPSSKQIIRMQALEEGVSSPTTIEELQDAIEKYQYRIEDILNADIRIGLWYKILATRYLDNKMYKEALDNFRTAIEYYPTNQNLYYYVGVCAGYMAKASLDYEAAGDTLTRKRYYDLAVSAYQRAIELEPRYVRALYGLSILYVFELDQSEKAIPLLELVLEIEKRNTDAMFVLARAHYVNGNNSAAVALYDRIIQLTGDPERKAEATENRQFILELGDDD